MTRVVVDPEELKRVAGYMAEAAEAYRGIASQLAARPLPEMPPALAAAVGAGVGRAVERLNELGSTLDGNAYLLRTRAAIVDGGTALTLLLESGSDLGS